MVKQILVAGPFIGEVGWECFSWQPMVRREFLRGSFEWCHVFTGHGRNLFYPFATVHPFKRPKELQAECNTIHATAPAKQLLAKMITEFENRVSTEFTGCVRLSPFRLPFNKPLFDRGAPNLILPDREHPCVPKSKKRTAVLCVRDRGFASGRNWDSGKWAEVASLLNNAGIRTVVIGQTNKDFKLDDGVINLTGQTTLDDVIRIFGVADIAIGGSTGTLHLASRCGLDHLVWGIPRNVPRYAKTNWFGAACRVLPIGFSPKLSTVASEVSRWIKTSKLLGKGG